MSSNSHTSPPPRRARKWTPGQFISGIRQAIVQALRMPLRRSGVYLATLVLALLTLSLMINFINQVIQSANLEARRAELQAEVAELDADNTHLRQAAEYAESDVHVERVAREQLGYAREGETVLLLQLVDPTPTPAPEQDAPPADVPTPEVPPNWQRWWTVFVAPEPHVLPDEARPD